MVHGTPDWGLTAGQATVYQLTDLGELAVRLGSIVSFDRRGDVVWLDDFEDGANKWEVAVAGTGAAVAISTARARNGAQSILLTAGSDGARYAQIGHFQAIPSLSNLGVEFSFAHIAALDNLLLELDVNTGSRLLTPRIRYDEVNSLILYKDAAGVDQELGPSNFFTADWYRFSTIKLVVDLEAEEYVRLIVDLTVFNMAGIPLAAEDNSAAGNASTTIRNTGDAGFNNKVYVDDVILTQNEPA